MIIRYQKTEKIGDHSTTSILTVKDADQSSLDKVLKYFEPQDSQQQIAIRNAQDESKVEPLPSDNDTDFIVKKRVEKDVVEAILAKGFNKEIESAKDEAPTILKHPEGKVVKKQDVKPSRPRRLPLLRGNLTENGPQVLNENMKVFNEVMHYNTKLECPNCGNERDVWSRSHNSYTKCMKCGTKIEQEPATDKMLETDADGYYFKANKPYRGE